MRLASKLAADPSLDVITPESGLKSPHPTAPHSLALPYCPSCNIDPHTVGSPMSEYHWKPPEPLTWTLKGIFRF